MVPWPTTLATNISRSDHLCGRDRSIIFGVMVNTGETSWNDCCIVDDAFRPQDNPKELTIATRSTQRRTGSPSGLTMAILEDLLQKGNNSSMYILPHSGNHKPATLENETHVYDIYDWEWPQDEDPRHPTCMAKRIYFILSLSTEHDVHPAWPSSTRLHRQCELLYGLYRADFMQCHTLLHFRQYRHIN